MAKKGGGGEGYKAHNAGTEPLYEDGVCWNCGEKGFMPKTCKTPQDKARQQRCYEAWKKAGKPKSGSTSNKKAPSVASPSSATERQRKVWGASGIHTRNGDLMANWKTCGGWYLLTPPKRMLNGPRTLPISVCQITTSS